MDKNNSISNAKQRAMTSRASCGNSHASTLMLVMLSTATVVQAQSPVLEEVMVTAERRQQSIQDVPISMVAMNQDTLFRMGVDEIEDLAARVPNLFVNNFNTDASTVRLFIRGVGINDVQLTQDPSVALYQDGVYVGTSIGAGLEVAELERIEVLRGPQGTLYGRNATGGAVNFITTKPVLDEWQFKQNFTVGNYDLFSSKTTINVPLSERIAARINILDAERGGVVDNKGPGVDFSEQDRQAVRLALRYQPADTLMVDYSYEQSDIEDSNPYSQITHGAPVNLGFLSTTFTEPVASSRLDSVAAVRHQEHGNVDVEGHTLTFTWDASDSLTLTSISAYRDMRNNNFYDSFPTAYVQYIATGAQQNPILMETERVTRFEQWSQEFQLVGGADTAFGAVDYAAGLYFYKDEGFQSVEDVGFNGTAGLLDETETKNRSIAAYGQATVSPELLSGKGHITLGGRFSKDTREAIRRNLNSPSFAVLPGGEAHYDKTFSNFNPSLTLAYDLSDTSHIYAKVLTGYKSGGTSQRSANPILFAQGFEEEDVISYELGLKSEWLNSRLRFNMALFSMQIDGFQTSIQSGFTTSDRDFVGIDDTAIDGVEMDVNWMATDNLVFELSYGYLNTDMGANEVNAPDQANVITTTQLIDDLVYAPRHAGSLSADYRIDLASTELSFYLSYSYQDRSNTSSNAIDNSVIDARELVDATVTWSGMEALGGILEVSLWAKNLLDDDYKTTSTAGFSFFGIEEQAVFGEPRTYGVTLRYTY